MRKCIICGKDLARYQKKYCSDCAENYQQIYYINNIDKRRASSNRYYHSLKEAANKLKIIEQTLKEDDF